MLTTGIAWQRLPQELGYGSGMTCWRRLHEWQQAGVLQHLHQLLLAKLGRWTGSRRSRRSAASADDPDADPTLLLADRGYASQ